MAHLALVCCISLIYCDQTYSCLEKLKSHTPLTSVLEQPTVTHHLSYSLIFFVIVEGPQILGYYGQCSVVQNHPEEGTGMLAKTFLPRMNLVGQSAVGRLTAQAKPQGIWSARVQ